MLELGAPDDRGAKRLLRAGAAQVLYADGLTPVFAAADTSVDVVVCLGLLAELSEATDRERLLDEVRRVLRDDGFFVAGTPGASSGLVGAAPRPGIPRDELTALLGRHFRVVEIVAQTPLLGFSLAPPGADEMAVSEALAPVAGEPSHLLAFCTAASERVWQLAESLLVTLPYDQALLDGGRRDGAAGEETLRLRRELEEARAEVMRLHGRAAKLERLEREARAGEATASAASARAARLATDVAHGQALAQTLEARLAVASGELGDERQARARAERVEAQLRADLARAQARLAEEQARFAGIEAQAADGDRRRADLQRRADSAEAGAAEMALERDRAVREWKDLLEAHRDAAGEHGAREGRLQEIEAEVTRYRDQALAFEGQAADLRRELGVIGHDLSALKLRYGEVARERDNLREEILALDDREHKLRAEEERLAARATAAESERNQLRLRIAQSEAAREEVTRLRIEINRRDEVVAALRVEADQRLRVAADQGAVRDELLRERAEAVRRADDAERDLRSAREELRAAAAELGAATAGRDEAERELAGRMEEAGTRGARIAALEGDVTRMIGKLAGERARADAIVAAREESEAKMEGLLGRLSEREDVIAARDAELAARDRQLAELRGGPAAAAGEAALAELGDLRRRLREAEAAATAALGQVAALEESVSSTNARIAELSAIAASRAQAAARFKEEGEQARRRSGELVEELAGARAEADRLRVAGASAAERGKLARGQLEREIEVRSSEHAELLRRLERKESELWERSDEATRNGARIQASVDAAEKARAELADARQEMARLRGTVAAAPAGPAKPDDGGGSRRIAELEAELKALRMSYAKVNAELTRERYLRKSGTPGPTPSKA